MSRPIITLTHHERGKMRVYVSVEASYWTRGRQWASDDDPDLGHFCDDDFLETPLEISDALWKADR